MTRRPDPLDYLLDEPIIEGRLAGTVYMATNTKTGERYVGATSQSLRRRWKHHRKFKKKERSPFHRAICQYGAEAFKLEALVSCIDIEALAELEAQIIAQVNPEYNRVRVPMDIWSEPYAKVSRRKAQAPLRPEQLYPL